METKKSKSADLERRRGTFLALGLVLGSSVVLMAFTYNSVQDNSIAKIDDHEALPPDWIPEYEEEETQEPVKPEVAPPPPMVEDIEIVDDREEVEEFTFITPEDIEVPCDDCEEEFDVIIDTIIEIPDEDPRFCAGEQARVDFIRENFNFDNIYDHSGCSGTVYVSFVVEKAGDISDVKILRGVCEEVDAEAIRVCKAMPCWIPGEQAGKKVRCRFTMPISVTLE
jgi:protein TonB